MIDVKGFLDQSDLLMYRYVLMFFYVAASYYDPHRIRTPHCSHLLTSVSHFLEDRLL